MTPQTNLVTIAERDGFDGRWPQDCIRRIAFAGLHSAVSSSAASQGGKGGQGVRHDAQGEFRAYGRPSVAAAAWAKAE
jgi:hypothetical protein